MAAQGGDVAGSTRIPVRWSLTISGIPPTRLAMTARACAAASKQTSRPAPAKATGRPRPAMHPAIAQLAANPPSRGTSRDFRGPGVWRDRATAPGHCHRRRYPPGSAAARAPPPPAANRRLCAASGGPKKQSVRPSRAAAVLPGDRAGWQRQGVHPLRVVSARNICVRKYSLTVSTGRREVSRFSALRGQSRHA